MTDIAPDAPLADDAPAAQSGTLMLSAIAGATVALTATIAGFCALGSWTLLPVMMALLLLTAAAVVALLVQVMGDDDAAGGH